MSIWFSVLDVKKANNIQGESMSDKNKNQIPHLFYPHTAKSLGLNAAAVELAIYTLEEKWDEVLNLNISDVIDECDYLTPAEVCDAVKLLQNDGLVHGLLKGVLS